MSRISTFFSSQGLWLRSTEPCVICDRKTMVNSALCKSCRNWMHGSCAKVKLVTNGFSILEMQWVSQKHGMSYRKLHDDVEKRHVVI